MLTLTPEEERLIDNTYNSKKYKHNEYRAVYIRWAREKCLLLKQHGYFSSMGDVRIDKYGWMDLAQYTTRFLRQITIIPNRFFLQQLHHPSGKFNGGWQLYMGDKSFGVPPTVNMMMGAHDTIKEANSLAIKNAIVFFRESKDKLYADVAKKVLEYVKVNKEIFDMRILKNLVS